MKQGTVYFPNLLPCWPLILKVYATPTFYIAQGLLRSDLTPPGKLDEAFKWVEHIKNPPREEQAS